MKKSLITISNKQLKLTQKNDSHPALLVNEIMKLVGNGYDKKKGEVNKFMGRISKEDFHKLFKSNKCNSFRNYCNSLELNTTPNQVGD